MRVSRLIARSTAWFHRLGHDPAAVAAPPSPVPFAVWRGARPAPAGADPEAVVRAFIADYAAWNDRAWADAAEGSAADDAQVDAAYREAVGPHLAVGVRTLPAAFDGDALHVPEHEAVVDVRVEGTVAQVRTRTAARRPDGPHHAFEYRLRLDGGRWAIEAVDQLDANGARVPTL